METKFLYVVLVIELLIISNSKHMFKNTLSVLVVFSVLMSTSVFAQFGGGPRGNFEMPEGWEEMTDDERKTYREENRPEGMEGRQGRRGNFETPEGWEEMTDDERKIYREENRPEGAEERQTMKGAMNYGSKSRKAKNYKKFAGKLHQKRQFKDENKISNQAAVSFLQQRGILDGYEDGSFGPENPINRAESLKVLLEALGEDIEANGTTNFSDVPQGAWFAKYVRRAQNIGIVKGYEDGSFRPAQTVNQVELLKLAFESFGIDLSTYEVTSSDIDSGAWYAVYLQYALDNNLLDKEDVDLANGMNRDAFSEVIYRLIQQQENL